MSTTERERITLGQIAVEFLATGAETGGHADVFEVTVAPGARVPVAHHHIDIDELVLGLEGVMTMTVGGVVQELRAGDRVLAPRGVVHHFANLHDTPARTLTVSTPGTLGPKYFRAIAELIAAGGPPDPARLRAVMLEHGLVAVAS